jgi:hypothetical protein
VHPYILVLHLSFSPCLPPYAWKKERGTKKDESEKENEIGRNTGISKVEQGWTPSTIMLTHLQKLVKHGFMVVAEIEACQVLEDHAFPMPTEGYVVSFIAFYKRGFSMPPHRFLRSLLWYYSLEPHHLTPSGLLHIVAFMTLCEAYLGIDPELELWKYFFASGVHKILKQN